MSFGFANGLKLPRAIVVTLTLMARQVRQMAHEMDMDVEPPRMN